MAPVGQVLGRKLFSKTKMCKFHRAGKCAKGEQCPWAHDPSELQAAPDLRRTKICKELVAKGKCTNAHCSFAHSKEERRSVAYDAGGLVHGFLSNPSPSPQSPVPAAKNLGSHATMDVPDFVPPLLTAEAPDFVPMSYTAKAPAFVPMISPPPGLEDCVPYRPTLGYSSFHREESESDSSSTDDIQIDGNTPISQILALSMAPEQKSSKRHLSRAKLASVSTAGSLVDLQLSSEDLQFLINHEFAGRQVWM